MGLWVSASRQVSDLQKRKSITDFAFTCDEGAMSHESKTQTLTADSSAEAEFIATFDTGKIGWCLQFVLQELGFPRKAALDSY